MSHRHPRNSNLKKKTDQKKSEIDLPELECPICKKNIRYLASAICLEKDKSPAHFDCVIEKLRQENELMDKERICYLGNGSFGIIKSVEGNSPSFFIRKRIQFEEPETHPEWRKNMQSI